jgi:hypothetical protein
MHGKPFCIMHSPLARAIQTKGGQRRAIFNPKELKPFTPPQSAQELGALIAQTIIEIRETKIDTKSANAIACLAGSFLASLNHGEVEMRLEQLEKQFEEREARTRGVTR